MHLLSRANQSSSTDQEVRLHPSGASMVGGLMEATTNPLARKLFLPAYKASDERYWQRRLSECQWRSLGNIIEYSPDFFSATGKGKYPVLLIAIRSKTDTHLKRLTIKVKAKKSGVLYSQSIRQSHLDRVPVRKAVTVLPLQSQEQNATGRHKLGDFYIKLEEAVDGSGVDLINGKKIAEIFSASVEDAGVENDVRFLDQYWNVDAIDHEKENIRTHHYRRLVHSARQNGRSLALRRMAYRLVSSRLGLSLAFWHQNLGSAGRMRESMTSTS